MIRGGLQVQESVVHVGLDAPLQIVHLGAALAQSSVGFLYLAFGSPAFPNRYAQRADHRESTVRLRRIDADRAVVGRECQRGQPRGSRL